MDIQRCVTILKEDLVKTNENTQKFRLRRSQRNMYESL